MNDTLPYLVAVNVTRQCNLNCAHCYLDAKKRRGASTDELTCGEIVTLLGEIAEHAPGTIVVLTGGEPLLHPDIERMVAEGVSAGLRMVIGTNGVLLTEDRIKRLQELGLSGVGISLDAIEAESHDAFRGSPGSYQKSCAAIRLCARHGLHVQLHFTVTRKNHRCLERVVQNAREMGASIVNFFFLVCVGRAQPVMDLTPAQYETALHEIVALQKTQRGIMVNARCAPHIKRILYEEDPNSPYTRATGYDGGGCPAGTHYCRVSPVGDVTPCPYMELSAGNIRSTSFWEIWRRAPLFQTFRQPDLDGRCGRCEYRLLCGGCRARSLAQGGRLLGEDPNCDYMPGNGDVVAAENGDSGEESHPVWTEEARNRLEKVPIFLRTVVKRKLEERAAREGVTVTVEMMRRHRQERERELGIHFTERRSS